MNDTPSSQHLDTESPDDLQAIAAAIFARHGIDFADVRRGGGWTNAVWLADGLVLRLCTTLETGRLQRESRLATLFPPGVGYPALVDAGVTEGHAWTLAKRLPGRCLGEIWGELSWDERATALYDLWLRAEAVHAVPADAAAEIARTRAWFNANDPAEAEAGLSRLTDQAILTRAEAATLRGDLRRFWEALPATPLTLCHGDMTLDNAIWHAGHVIALIDFEHALIAPVHLDLNHLIKIAYGPSKGGSVSAADQKGAAQLRRTAAILARPWLAQPGGKALLVGYAILLDLWRLEDWLAHAEGEGPLETWDPLRRVRALADGSHGYLAQLA
ncbi:MAG: aminoglycoside phosphotransferase family protein [Anaerolineae bacterium]|nr:aminoglycoside phosphotransferase family protein [Anaerolineae bacterium]